ncbi:MAG: phage head-tail joining protein [Inquilinus sp.]|uniref:phage head-tail joining protein n=1 Tax=Inquilinus sp. TaxID=1932117 RepID=UPI003F2CBB8D
MAFTQAFLDALDAAIASGTESVNYDGKAIKYRSLDELLRARAIVAADLQRQAGLVPARTNYASFSRG